jgi:hypothetical protein
MVSHDENRATERGFHAVEAIHNKSSTTDAQTKGQNMLNEIIQPIDSSVISDKDDNTCHEIITQYSGRSSSGLSRHSGAQFTVRCAGLSLTQGRVSHLVPQPGIRRALTRRINPPLSPVYHSSLYLPHFLSVSCPAFLRLELPIVTPFTL